MVESGRIFFGNIGKKFLFCFGNKFVVTQIRSGGQKWLRSYAGCFNGKRLRQYIYQPIFNEIAGSEIVAYSLFVEYGYGADAFTVQVSVHHRVYFVLFE